MNIQIFGKAKCFDTKKAERYFKERGIKYQLINILDKGMSKGEFRSVSQALGGYRSLLDQNCRDKDLLALLAHLMDEDMEEKILENQQVIWTPIVREGKRATVGYEPEVWKKWEAGK